MNQEELHEKIGRCFSHFRMKAPDIDTRGLWFEELNHIPNEAGEWISRRICREADGMPRNIVKAFKDLWRAWQAEFPEKVKRPEPVFCQVCGLSGLIWFQYQVAGHGAPHTSFVRCGHCSNHQLLNVPADTPCMKAGEIVRMGGQLDWRNSKRRKPDAMARKNQGDVEFGKMVKLKQAV